MKALSFAFVRLASALLAGTLAGCASWPGHEPVQGAAQGEPGARPARGASRPAPSGAGRLAMGDMMGDVQAMCELDRRMMAARTPEARHAMVDKYMGAMTPETRHHLLTMMREQCR